MGNIRIRRILIFLFVTFLLSWGFDWFIIVSSGINTYSSFGMSPWGMLVPAFVAIILQMFVFNDSPVYYRVYRDKPRWILTGFLILTFLYGILTVFTALHPELKRILPALGAVFFTLWTLMIFFIHGRCGQASFERAGLRLGNISLCRYFILGIVLFFFLQAAGNLIFDCGDFAGRAGRIYGLPVPQILYYPSLIILFVFVTVIGIPLSGLAGVFGEEYGWRGFLLSELIELGKLKAVLLVGIIWGIWHFPVILRGIHTYPPSAAGLLMGVVFFVLWGIIQGYAVFKTGSIWIAAFMHGVVNSVYSFSLVYIVKPDDNIFSFGLGIYGLLCTGIIVYFILKDPVWKNE